MAAAVPCDLQAFHEHCHLLCAQLAVPSRNRFAFSRDPKAGSSWQLPTEEAENSENTYFSHEIKSAPFLSLTHIHNSATDGRAESSGLRAGIASSSATGACCIGQTISSSLYHPLLSAAQTLLLIYLPGGRAEAFGHNCKVLCSAKINTLSLVGI